MTSPSTRRLTVAQATVAFLAAQYSERDGVEQRLPEAGDVAVAEDAEAALEEPVLDAVALAALRGEEPYGRLRDGEPDGCAGGHVVLRVAGVCAGGWAEVSGRRGSTGWSAQVPRIQACAGSSQNFQTRSAPGPAMTLR